MLDTCLKWIKKNRKWRKMNKIRTEQSYLGPLQKSSPRREGRVFPLCLHEPHCFEDRRVQGREEGTEGEGAAAASLPC